MNQSVRLMMKFLEGQTIPAKDLDSLIQALYDEGLKVSGSIPQQAAQELGRDLDSASATDAESTKLGTKESAKVPDTKEEKSPPVST